MLTAPLPTAVIWVGAALSGFGIAVHEGAVTWREERLARHDVRRLAVVDVVFVALCGSLLVVGIAR